MVHCFKNKNLAFHLLRVTLIRQKNLANPKAILNGEQNFNAMTIGTGEGTIQFKVQ